MDPSIMKLLEEDEDETMHSGADVEAFTAALNRDIEGDTSTPQPSDSDSTALSQGSSHTPNQFLPQWQTAKQDEISNPLSQQDPNGVQKNEPLSTKTDLQQQATAPENQKQPDISFKEGNIFSFQQKPSQDDFHQPTSEQNVAPVSQPIKMQDLDSSNQGHDQTQKAEHQAQLVRLETANSPQVPLPAMSNQQSLPATMSNQHVMAPGTSNSQAMAAGSASQQVTGAANRGKQVPFALLLPVIQPQLDKDRQVQLNNLYSRLRRNEISKDGFVRVMRNIVGDPMLKSAVFKLQSQATRSTQNVPGQPPSQSQVAMQQQNLPTQAPAQIMNASSNQMPDGHSVKSGEVDRLPDSHEVQLNQLSNNTFAVNQDREHPTFPAQSLNKPQPQPQAQHMQFPHMSFPAYGATGGIQYRPYSAMSPNISQPPLKQQVHDSQMRPVPAHQAVNTSQLGSTTQAINMVGMPKFDRQNSFNDQKRLPSGTMSPMTSNSALPQNSVQWQAPSTKEQKSGHVKQEPLDQSNEIYKSQFPVAPGLPSFPSAHGDQAKAKDDSEMQSARVSFSNPASVLPSNSVSSSMANQIEPSNMLSSNVPPATPATPPVGLGGNAKAPAKKPTVGQKKPLEALGSSPPPSSKKQKVSGAFLDQSIEQLNDVTAVSGVNLREEEEQLFSGPKEDSRVSEASRRVVQEEEDRLILEKVPLQQKLKDIVSKCGLKGISSDVERCLSLCVEERMRGLIGNLIRLSKQRLDVEKPRHKTIVTSDVRHQIMLINRKAQDEWEKKQAEAEKLQKPNEPEGNPGVDGEKEKDDGRAKSVKVPNKEEDDKMRTTAANVAARAAVGGDDMLSKWQLMAEKNKQKRAGGADAAPGSKPVKDVGRKLNLSKSSRDNQEAEKRGQSTSNPSSGASKKGRNQGIDVQPKVSRTISVKDVITALEREPQMSKSTLIYKLYEKIGSEAATGQPC
ncbi:OLC1v1016953C1 [Oldenlandia corymbosa var. corymbosa]|uniref:OLC1v1016953C1 n=1 Tax=Oldenlandia corymbosa var. corymbosa TaxID=529605 RepID=A0AAV1E8D3_OLDCO|nr:OLC1v1016953C1 [Oldenlandia corymbosa var. corymbosa]